MLPVPAANELRILGYTHYINTKDLTLSTLRADLALYCNIIGRKKASTSTKILALTSSVYQKILYRAQFSPMTLAEATTLDVPVNQFYRRLTTNSATYPTKLLYSDVNRGGFGFRRISDEIQQRKWNNFLSSQSQDRATKDAFESHLLRASRLGGYRLLHGQGGPIPQIVHRYWASSLLEAFNYAGLQLSRGGDLLLATPAEQLQSSYHLSKGHADLLRKFGIYNLGDISMLSYGATLWRDFTDTPLEFLNRIEQDPQPPQLPSVLGIHSLWRKDDKKVIEILGVMRGSDDICIRIWISLTGTITNG